MAEKLCKEEKKKVAVNQKFVCSKCKLSANKKEKLCKPQKS